MTFYGITETAASSLVNYFSKFDTSNRFLESFGLNSGYIFFSMRSFMLISENHGCAIISSRPPVVPSLSFESFFRHFLIKS